MMDVSIKEVKLQLGKKEVVLTVEQAKKLKAALDELFGKEVVREVYRDSYPYWYWYTTPWTYTGTPLPEHGTVWCSSNGSSASLSGETMILEVA